MFSPRLILPLVLIALLLSIAGMVTFARRDRAALRRVLATESLRRVQQAARAVEEDLDQIGDDLRLAGELALSRRAPADQERELGTLLAVVKAYRALVVYDRHGQVLLTVEDPREAATGMPTQFQEALEATARRAMLLPSGRVATSPRLSQDGTGWFRIFAAALPRGPDQPAAVIALLVDMEPLFAKEIHLLSRFQRKRLLLLGAYGLPAPATDPAVTRAVRRSDEGGGVAPSFRELVSEMRAGRQGTRLIDEAEGEQLGLDSAQVVAFAPIPMKGGGHWSLALLTSAEVLGPQEQAQLLRLVLLGGVVATVLSGAGLYAASASRRAEGLRERLRQAHELAHLHDKTEKILDHVPAGVMALSEDGRITALNRALRDRVPSDALGGRTAQAFPQAAPAALQQLEALMDGARGGGKPRSLLAARLSLFGEEGEYCLHAVPLEPRSPEAQLLLVIEDLSALRALESQLLRAEKLATVGVLAAGIAHEIGTPLSIIRGRAEYLASKLGGEHPQAAGARIIVDQIDQVTRTLRQLLDFARARPARVRPTGLRPVAQAVGDLFRIEAERRGLTLEVATPADLPSLSADPDQLQQVLVNLVMNACDACDSGGRICVAAAADEREPTAVRMEVRDSGCGIPEAHRNQVFDPFFTTKKRGQGTGLGLTVAAQIVRSHHGRIEIASEPGRGTRVIVLWPMASAMAGTLSGKESHGSGAEAHPHRG